MSSSNVAAIAKTNLRHSLQRIESQLVTVSVITSPTVNHRLKFGEHLFPGFNLANFSNLANVSCQLVEEVGLGPADPAVITQLSTELHIGTGLYPTPHLLLN